MFMPHLLDCPEIKHIPLFSFCVPYCPYRNSGPEFVDKSSACRDAESKLCAMGPNVAETQSTDPRGSTFLLMSRGVGRGSCLGRGWYFLLVSWSRWKTHSTPKAVCLQTGCRMRMSSLPVIISSQGKLIHQSIKFQIYWKTVYIVLK